MTRRVGAAIDLGSTSVHLLVAHPERGGLVALDDESTFLGLGAAVDGAGVLGAAGRAMLVETVGTYVARARQLGASRPILMGTEPLRRLDDAARIIAEVSAATGVPLAVLEHEEEALLTLVGLTAGNAVRNDLLVVDIGGGSPRASRWARGA
jgi:exopolyphosphatase/pppGpp-phosphohydrolase